MKVLRFGGSSLKSGEGIRRVCKIIANDDEWKVVVVSAISGVTEELIAFVSRCERRMRSRSSSRIWRKSIWHF